MTIIHDFKSLRDHMDKIIKRDEAREQAGTEPPPKQQQQNWCPVCGYMHTCSSCRAASQPAGSPNTSAHAPSAHDPAR